ncbi:MULTISPECIES: non-hydrolyzing UDP-N-acetylglucosamine 2-epimerase [Chryseobacterium]|uniref:UDP-N-acetylglucosamine 2-epimerase n=1 Tax=Chryseobacterium geocarposphaerae TaxID=1416776 RepID=A0ABU1LDF6_9FLAO|nr:MULTISPECIES: UDP-N-acetylglucosamine 2-epimerase (non-hydrolyzing) [Chryseobacterium]MDR6404753.1 UDP-N-acetylglucosamine 2-epimerase [Chryseobacterium geocarposphaerae]MDR6698014.1 UDP-N-acetylglucosamine 2-epimerase [Chryseobacterium ginsenosidimutans]
MKKIIAIIGARPQFIKHYPIDKSAKGTIDLITIHTGQHYDQEMSQIFFDELGMSHPNYQLSVGKGGHGAQTGKMLENIEEILINEKPHGIIVYGDTNSTLAGALAAAKLHIPIAHIEAGVRSYNKHLPEEVNRLLTDHLTSLFFIPTEKARIDLSKEGITQDIYEFGDIMKEVLDDVIEKGLVNSNIADENFYYTTIHRPYNTDDCETLKKLLNSLNTLNKKIVFAIHPRTEGRMAEYGLQKTNYKNISFIKPQSYIDNLNYINASSGVITDSGGIQKEAYWLKKKCITIRTETEWVETLENNWNILSSSDFSTLSKALEVQPGNYKELYNISETSKNIIKKINDKF